MRSEDSVRVAGTLIGSDRRCYHYWEDVDWTVSTRLRTVLGFGPYDPKQSAWDVYLLYRPGTVWTDAIPPPPSEWTHNLQEHGPERPRITTTLLSEWSSMAT